jgi:hypothetical protein
MSYRQVIPSRGKIINGSSMSVIKSHVVRAGELGVCRTSQTVRSLARSIGVDLSLMLMHDFFAIKDLRMRMGNA